MNLCDLGGYGLQLFLYCGLTGCNVVLFGVYWPAV